MEEPDIKGYLPSSLLDYPGKIVSVVFVSGCNFHCPFCFNIELVQNSKELKKIDPAQIIEHLKLRRKWLDGICITGGEPTLYKGLFRFISEVKSLGFLVKLDTNGTDPEMLKELIKKKLVDYIAMDIKTPLEKYQKAVKMKIDTDKIRESVDLIKGSGVDYEFRTTVVPSLLGKEDILAIGKWLKGSKRYFLQQFRPEKTLDPKLRKEKPYSIGEMEEMAEIAKPFFGNVEIRNL
jgi:pyruvate formate lyase activating enzyme